MPVTGIEDICNLALDRIGYREMIGSIYEGSIASQVGLRQYGQTRDEVLRSNDWEFARRVVTLTELKDTGLQVAGQPYDGKAWATQYAMPGYLFEYVYPVDSIRLLYVRPSPTSIPNYAPTPVLFKLGNDTTVLDANKQPSKVILTNQGPPALAVYTGQILDWTQWEPLFLEALVGALGKKFTTLLGATPELLKMTVPEADASLQKGAMRQE